MKYYDIQKQLEKENKKISISQKQDIEYLNIKISQMVQLARMDKGLTQSQLAKKLGTKQPSIARLESGKKSPTILFLNQIAKALDTYLVEPRFKSIEHFYSYNYVSSSLAPLHNNTTIDTVEVNDKQRIISQEENILSPIARDNFKFNIN